MARRKDITRHAPVITARVRATKRAKGTAAPETPAAVPPRAAVPARAGGRPSREAAKLLGGKILDVATALFLREGYGAVSIEMLARDARISKRTFYQRFPNKAALFTAVVHRIIERLRPGDDANLFDGDDLKAILLRLAKIILDAALSPGALALHRIVIAEATRFPQLAMIVSQQNAGQEAVGRIRALLEREAAAGRIVASDCGFVATQFLYMVIALPQRRALGGGVAMTAKERDAWVRNTVNLLLNGCRAPTP
jgi:AcrR family transcriptional regulator